MRSACTYGECFGIQPPFSLAICIRQILLIEPTLWPEFLYQ